MQNGWNDFEVQLGNLYINKFVSKFTPPAKPVDEIIAEAKRKREFEERYNIPPSLHFDSYCAKRLKGLLDVLQYCFEKWVDNCQRSITNPKYVHIEGYYFIADGADYIVVGYGERRIFFMVSQNFW